MSVSRFSTSLVAGFAAFLLAGASANAGLVYLEDSNGNLWAGDPSQGSEANFSFVGNSYAAGSALIGTPNGFADIDFVNGVLYGVDQNGLLYSINTSNAQATLVGTGVTGFNGSAGVVGLAGQDSTGLLYAGGDNQMYTISPGSGPGATALCVNTCGGYETSGDLDFTPDGLFLTSIPTGDDSTNADDLYVISTSVGTAGVGSKVGQLPFSDVFGVAYDSDNGVFYGYDSGFTQFNIDTTTPGNSGNIDDETYVLQLGQPGESARGSLFGAAFVSTPEPASMALIGFGMLGLGLITRKRR